jgi:hypothetical protein
LFAYVAVNALLDGKRVIEAAPIVKQTDAFWRKCNRYLRPLIDAGFVKRNKTDRTLEMGDGSIQAQTAYDADSLRGDNADLLLLDEYSYMDRSAWETVGIPMLLARNGDAWFAFTPNLKNHAFQLYNHALHYSDTWAAFHGTSYDNPKLSKRALELMTQDMTEENKRQEIYAEFLEGEGAVFRNIDACMKSDGKCGGVDIERGYDYTIEHKHPIVAGIDWGKQNDFTVISIGCAKCKKELFLDRFNQIDYHFQRGRIEAAFKQHKVGNGMVELNSIGEPNFEELVRSGLPVNGFDTTASSKPPLIENLALALEKTEWQFLPDEVGKSELEAYERKVNANTGRSSYGAPEGLHDDTVVARALMLRMATDRTTIVENPFADW